jgi:uncharacterized protein YdaU (DUF1376 family)
MKVYPFHIGDYMSATLHLSWDEDHAYRRLLDSYYETEKPLPADVRACCRLVLAATDEQREAVKIVLREFFNLTEVGWTNARAELEISAMRDKQAAARQSALIGVEMRTKPANARQEAANAAQKPANAPQKLLPDVDPETLADWMTIRRAKHSPLTPTAVARMRAEAEKAGLSMQDVLLICCERSWVAFRADWDWRPRRAGNGAAQETAKQREARELFENLARSRKNGTGKTIDGSAERVD